MEKLAEQRAGAFGGWESHFLLHLSDIETTARGRIDAWIA
jgi:hypothetical protein